MRVNTASMIKGVAMVGFAAAVCGVVASAMAGGPFGGPCVKGVSCPAVYAPVTCPNGQTYSNACEAWRIACQTNCVPGDVSQ